MQRTIGKNFTEEKMNLINIFQERVDLTIIESKKYGLTSVSEKGKAWEEISKTYNEQNPTILDFTKMGCSSITAH